MVFAWNDNWRKHPLISNNMRFNIMLPGFTWGAAAFAAYLVGTKVMEYRNKKANTHGHGDAHGHNEHHH